MTTIFTLGPGASAFALEPAYEKVVCRQRKAEKKAKENLKKSQRGSRLQETVTKLDILLT